MSIVCVQKNETNKDGGGKGEWSAWKAAKLSQKYEEKGANLHPSRSTSLTKLQAAGTRMNLAARTSPRKVFRKRSLVRRKRKR